MKVEETGKFFESNSKKLDEVSELEWKIALKKCEKHLSYKLRNRTKYGAHTVQNLGVPPMEYYMEYAFVSVIFGHWKWKDKFDLTQQLIRIVESRISTVVESFKSKQEKNLKRDEEGKYLLTSSIEIVDIEESFYKLYSENEIDKADLKEREERYNFLEEYFANSEDDDVIMFWECIKEGYKREQIAELMEKTPKQFDKVREKFLRKIRKEIEGDGSK